MDLIGLHLGAPTLDFALRNGNGRMAESPAKNLWLMQQITFLIARSGKNQ